MLSLDFIALLLDNVLLRHIERKKIELLQQTFQLEIPHAPVLVVEEEEDQYNLWKSCLHLHAFSKMCLLFLR